MKRDGDYYIFKPGYGFNLYEWNGVVKVLIPYMSKALSDKHLYKIIGDKEIIFAKGHYPHRTDGPAVIPNRNLIPNSSRTTLWFLNGFAYSKEEWFSKLTKEQLTLALANPDNF